jgi:gamma-glutamylcysteine synthetase
MDLMNAELNRLLQLRFGRKQSKSLMDAGLELEYQVCTTAHHPPKPDVVFGLFAFFERELGFERINPVLVSCPLARDRITIEYSLNNLEIILEKSDNLHELQSRGKKWLDGVMDYLSIHGHQLIPQGSNPFKWVKKQRAYRESNYYVHIERMLVDNHLDPHLGDPYFSTQISASQVHIDLYSHQVVEVFNVLEEVDAVKYLIFANSPIVGGTDLSGITLCARNYLWKNSAFGNVSPMTGIYGKQFQSMEEIVAFEREKTIFKTKRDDRLVFFAPTSLNQYFEAEYVDGYLYENGVKLPLTIEPELGDLDYFRPYNHYAATAFGTVEIRSECAQPVRDFMLPAAFNLGLLSYEHTLDELCALKRQYRFDLLYGHFVSQKGRQRMQSELIEFLIAVVDIAQKGLSKRNQMEEKLLDSLYDRISSGYNPAMRLLLAKKNSSHDQ